MESTHYTACQLFFDFLNAYIIYKSITQAYPYITTALVLRSKLLRIPEEVSNITITYK